MHKQFYFLSPVEVVKVTSQNLEEVAQWCGGSIQETESRRVPGRMDKYVLVPTPKETQISWAFPGMFITKRLVLSVKNELRTTFAVFRRDYFEKNYFNTPKEATDKTWEREHDERTKKPKPEINIMVNVGQALIEAQEKVKALEAKLEAEGLDPEVEESEVDGGDPMSTALKLVDGTENKVVNPTEVEVAAEPDGFVHEHLSTEGCDEAQCDTDRYVDGIHVFKDRTINTLEEDSSAEAISLNRVSNDA